MTVEAGQLLGSGIYTIPQVALLVSARIGDVRVWVEGRQGKRAQQPVIRNQIGRIGRTVAVSFTNLMELRFVARFSGAGVRLNAIRDIMDEVKELLNHPHPFATRIVFKTDGKKVVAELLGKNGFHTIYDPRTRNYEMWAIVLQSLKEDVIFDPSGEIAAWFPRKAVAPNVILHPAYSFGRPILRRSRIPTEAIAEAFKAERSQQAVAELYDISVGQVREALNFEKHLRMAA
jgi:uncharacterized protein (DUF433 family)